MMRVSTLTHYAGIKTKYVRTRFRGDVLYNAERDVNLAHLTVGETLTFAARARSMRTAPPGLTRTQMENMLRDVIMTVLGISHTFDTRVGDDFVRGVSGGERKRVSISHNRLNHGGMDSTDLIKSVYRLVSQKLPSRVPVSSAGIIRPAVLTALMLLTSVRACAVKLICLV